MSIIKKTTIWVVVLVIFCGLIIWHAFNWHSTGMYLVTFNWLQTGKGYLTILYNLGMMLVLGIILGLLMEKITDLIEYKSNTKK